MAYVRLQAYRSSDISLARGHHSAILHSERRYSSYYSYSDCNIFFVMSISTIISIAVVVPFSLDCY